MDLFAADFWSALLAIVVIDLVLAGDNAIVIGLAARNLPKQNQKKVILWGTVGAIVIRAAATLAVVWLLKIPGLLLAGGLILLYIAYKLMVEEKDHDVEAKDNIFAAIRTIIIADAVMGLDNVLAVAGAAHGDFLLVVIGLLISVPIVVWGSTLFLKLMEKYPFIITIGAGVLAWTASKMIVGEKFMKPYFENDFIKYGFEILMIVVVLGLGMLKKKKMSEEKEAETEPSKSEV
ncbi:TerC family protein [Fictibacillus barbaricus]|uniref:YjbE family integral membrane protein n=1 Tax=Fictibacillus barbaricus TaxID=182136 RepID=A0ABU1TVM1_9BACL|nr:TerC family protein [Fictibacillus barbaricus]MDR7071254.1 YjbE family integral membrane protein [Fictibacillus barbaricus]